MNIQYYLLILSLAFPIEYIIFEFNISNTNSFFNIFNLFYYLITIFLFILSLKKFLKFNILEKQLEYSWNNILNISIANLFSILISSILINKQIQNIKIYPQIDIPPAYCIIILRLIFLSILFLILFSYKKINNKIIKNKLKD